MPDQAQPAPAGDSPNQEPIVIYLDRYDWLAQPGAAAPRHGQPAATRDPVHRRQYDRLLQNVDRHLERLGKLSAADGTYASGSGWTFFLDGTRGAGKSTFLRHLGDNIASDVAVHDGLCFLPVIDPSRIEHSEIPLLVILRHINKCVEHRLKRGSLDSEANRTAWKSAFDKVARGLALFAPGHHPLNDLDAELFLEWGMERAGDSLDLRKRLHGLFDLACRILDVRALMLAFDDADTDARQAVNLLECIRKYLDMPRLMVVVAGDMELYSLLVRRHFARTIRYDTLFGNAETATVAHKGRAEQCLRMIDQLEEQYLLKLFPTQRRAHLAPLFNTIEESTFTYLFSWNGTRREVREQFDQLLRAALRVRTTSDIALFRVFLLRQPLRSIVDLMAHCAPYLEWSPGQAPERSSANDLFNDFCGAMRALALTSLYKMSVDTDALSERSSPELCRAVFDLSRRGDDIDTAPYLMPTSADEDIRNCSAALAAEVARFCYQNPGALLRYLCRGPLNVLLYVLTRDGSWFNEQSDGGRQRFRQYLGIGRDEYALDWGRRATAQIGLHYLTRSSPSVQLGTYRVAAKSLQDLPPVIQLSLIKVTEPKGIRTYASLFTLLGLAERLLSEQHATRGILARDAIRHLLRKTYPTLTIPTPSWGAPNTAEPLFATRARQKADAEKVVQARKAEKAEEESADDELIERLLTPIEDWLHDARILSRHLAPSSVFIGKVANRLLLNLENVSESLTTGSADSKPVADVMEMYAVCLLNTLLVEEAEHHVVAESVVDTVSPVNRSNPRSTPDPFLRKLNATLLKELTAERWPLLAIVATCPLIFGLLARPDNYDAMFKKLLPKGSRRMRNRGMFVKIEAVQPDARAPVVKEKPARTGAAAPPAAKPDKRR